MPLVLSYWAPLVVLSERRQVAPPAPPLHFSHWVVAPPLKLWYAYPTNKVTTPTLGHVATELNVISRETAALNRNVARVDNAALSESAKQPVEVVLTRQKLVAGTVLLCRTRQSALVERVDHSAPQQGMCVVMVAIVYEKANVHAEAEEISARLLVKRAAMDRAARTNVLVVKAGHSAPEI